MDGGRVITMDQVKRKRGRPRKALGGGPPSEGPTVPAKASLPMEPLSLRPKDAARVIGVGYTKMKEMIAAGDVTVTRLGSGVTLVHVSSLRALLGEEKSPARER